MFSHMASFAMPGATSDGTRKSPPPPTIVKFPSYAPHIKEGSTLIRSSGPLITALQSVQRPADVGASIFEALGLHVLSDATPEDLIPHATYLPPVEHWRTVSPEALNEANTASKRSLNNGCQSPGMQAYLDREEELSIDNTAAFRTVRRLPPKPGEVPRRLGMAYEFYKNLEFFSGYWIDTSLSPSDASPQADTPGHMQTHVRTGTGSQVPGDHRQQLVTAFVKLVAYDFGCNVSFSRCEPRLHINTGPSAPPPSFFSSANMNFVFRTPKDRASARAGIVEGPLAGISCRGTTEFNTDSDSHLDLARESVSILLTAQHRAREGKRESRFGHGQWWTEKQRWGGGRGGPIGREGDKLDIPFFPPASPTRGELRSSSTTSHGPSPIKKPRKGVEEGRTMHIYNTYRKMIPPSPTWDRKARYSPIGRAPGQDQYDDVFLVSSLNHHVSIIRTRVPSNLLKALDGEATHDGWEDVVMWRSKWFDLFLKEERIAAMQLIWGMMSWLMREVHTITEELADSNAGPGETMNIDS